MKKTIFTSLLFTFLGSSAFCQTVQNINKPQPHDICGSMIMNMSGGIDSITLGNPTLGVFTIKGDFTPANGVKFLVMQKNSNGKINRLKQAGANVIYDISYNGPQNSISSIYCDDQKLGGRNSIINLNANTSGTYTSITTQTITDQVKTKAQTVEIKAKENKLKVEGKIDCFPITIKDSTE